jgi:hypothetical protein
MKQTIKNKVGNNLILSGIVLILLILIWIIFIIFNPLHGITDEKLAAIASYPLPYILQNIFAFFIAPVMVFMLVAIDKVVNKGNRYIRNIALIFISAYLVLSAISYGSQMYLLIRLIEYQQAGMARTWFFESPYSTAFFIKQTGYLFLSLGLLALFSRLLFAKGLKKWLGLLTVSSSLIFFIAFFASIAACIDWANYLTLISLILFIPICILIIIKGLRLKNKSTFFQRLKFVLFG